MSSNTEKITIKEEDEIMEEDTLRQYKIMFSLFFETLTKLEQEGNFEAYHYLLKKFETRITPQSGENFVENIKTLNIRSSTMNIGKEIEKIQNFDDRLEFENMYRLLMAKKRDEE